MGTRADFYVWKGADAEWLGSIGWDGYPDGIDDAVKQATTEPQFREALAAFAKTRDDWTAPADGWPWPWEDSRTTDYAYAFSDGAVLGSCFGHEWFKATEKEPELNDDPKVAVFPDMKKRAAVTMGRRSGIIVIGGR